jgi:hypothetical protein
MQLWLAVHNLYVESYRHRVPDKVQGELHLLLARHVPTANPLFHSPIQMHGSSCSALVQLDQATGKLTVDESFHDKDGQPGFSFDNRTWPQGWTGSATPHGAVFSR